ncbi:lipoyl domain-containing protein [Halococcus dombrowskii]|uniref:Lipoyl domain-containing protein n=1 Tax=Halococcus dombrowskii TaxID=179637 RepID=A0AAV3SDA1_HALDO|nr:lipoyl domain-containing protein [Halococcus dombrowskii]UOO95096.1 lipoyl domain-containing protein [Halococcus dombrowskii]
MSDETVAVESETVWPADSDDVEEAIVSSWFVREGTTVTEGDPIAEIQIEKVSLDVPAPATGEVRELLVDEQGEFERGDTLAWISTDQ